MKVYKDSPKCILSVITSLGGPFHKVWDLQSLKPQYVLAPEKASDAFVRTLQFDDLKIISASGDGTIKILHFTPNTI
jgi:WD40 repeat protein